MTYFFAQFAGNNVAVDTGASPRPEAIYERFRRMDPKEFSGTIDLMIAEGWIKSIEVIFAFMELQDADMVKCATFLLTEDARLWWESASVEFMTPRQGDSSMAEFVRKFERGCHFVPLIANDAREKLRNFIDGLRQVLRRDVIVAGPITYAVVVLRALVAEQGQRDIENDRQGKMP
ncbi:uncharacterized protein [Primulina eburnea]|uniref:uncharacterized protein n=1 Tax=Primulina eburnea TaxID=1245227 RepID=UPI003C6BD9B4